jgi:hypothetical protein
MSALRSEFGEHERPRGPAVSILMATHRSGYLPDALASVRAQTRQDFQLLMDYTPGAPLGARLNRLASIAVGTWFVILCDDDRLSPDFLDELLRAADTDPVARVLYSDVTVLRDDGGLQRAHMKPWTLDSFREGPPCWITSLVRRDLWQQIGGHDTALAYHDYDFWYRCYLAGAQARHVAAPLWQYREHPQQWTHRVDRTTARAAIEAKHPELAKVTA